MSNALYSMINPVVSLVLRSPLHGLMSRNTMLLEFTGRKSGKTYSMPVSYHATNGHVHCFTSTNSQWWRNLRDGREVRMTLRGHRVAGTPTVLTDGSEAVRTALHDFLLATPRDASPAGVSLEASGHPVAADVLEASKRLAFISIEPRGANLEFGTPST